jgi:formylglycine-generating enzyme required for sulfatase activity
MQLIRTKAANSSSVFYALSVVLVISCADTSARFSERVVVPAGTYAAGCGAAEGCGIERTRTVRSTGFSIDRYEATVEMYDECVREAACTTLNAYDRRTVANAPAPAIALVSPLGAVAYCRWRRGRIPTEIEWVISATGGDGRRFSWGNEFSELLLPRYFFRSGFDSGYYFSPGTNLAGESPFGVSDITGSYPEFVLALTGAIELRGASANPREYPTDPDEYSVLHSKPLHGVAVGGVRCVY